LKITAAQKSYNIEPWLEKQARDKRSSLFGLFVSYDEKVFKIFPPGVNDIKLFVFVAEDDA
jgi:hypothetical protein